MQISHFFTATKTCPSYQLRTSTSCSQELDKIHVRKSVVDLRRSHCLRAKSLLGLDWTCACVHEKRVNIKSAIIMAGTMTSCSTAILAAKKHTADLALAVSRFSHAFLQVNFTSKWWLWSRVEARNFTKNKLLKLNEDRLSICWLKSEHDCLEKRQIIPVSWMMLYKQGALDIETWLLFAPPSLSKFLSARLFHGTKNRFIIFSQLRQNEGCISTNGIQIKVQTPSFNDNLFVVKSSQSARFTNYIFWK